MREHFFERRATEEGVDPVQNPSERGFAQAPHPSSRSLERRTDDDERSAQRNRALNRIRPTTIRNVLPCRERDMATTATPPNREAEERETRSVPPTKWSLAICKLACRRLMSSLTNCEVAVSDVVSMIVIIPPHDSRTTVSTPDGRAVTWKRPRGDRVRDQYEERRREHHRRDIRDIDCDDGSGVRLPFTGRIRVTEVRHPRTPDRRNVRRRRSMPAASAGMRHVTPAGSAAGRSGALYSAPFVFRNLAGSGRSRALRPSMG